MNNIKSFFEKYKFQLLLIVVIIGMFFYILRINNKLAGIEAQSIVDNNNHVAFNDSVTIEFNKKTREYEFTTTSFIGKLEDLETYNKKLSDKLSNMKGDILAAVDASINIMVDEVRNVKTTVSQDNDSTFISKGVYSVVDSGFSQKLTVFDKLRISPYYIKTRVDGKDTIIVRNRVSSLGMDFSKSEIKMDLIFGFLEEKKQYKVWASSPSKYVDISELAGYYKYFPKTYKPWVVGVGIGYGANYSKGFVTLGPTLNVFVGYKLFEFGKKTRR